MKRCDHKIHKRTFEGPDDNPITSRYRPSYKWVLAYRIEGYDHVVYEVCRTKEECIEKEGRVSWNND